MTSCKPLTPEVVSQDCTVAAAPAGFTRIYIGAPAGGAMDGIVINSATAEARKNVVDGIFIGLGGWSMDHVWFHDNVTRNTYYGFNADSFSNSNITLQNNQFIHPREYGIIMGGGSPLYTFANWTVLANTITLNASNSAGIGMQDEVQNSAFAGNTIQSDPARRAIWLRCGAFPRRLECPTPTTLFRITTLTRPWASIFPRPKLQ
jgi:hypothetical protein